MSKTLHMLVRINNYIVEILVNIGVSMSMFVATIIREFGIMHLVAKSESYKIASNVVT
jgi:hypothetical protein